MFTPGGGGGGLLGSIFAGYVLLASQSPYPIIVYSVANLIDPMLVTFGQICHFRDPNLVTLYLYMYVILNKEHLLFTYSTDFLVRLLTVNMKDFPKTQKMYHTILLTLLKMRPHDSQSSRENAAPSSGTSPVASYKEVPPPPPRDVYTQKKVTVLIHT